MSDLGLTEIPVRENDLQSRDDSQGGEEKRGYANGVNNNRCLEQTLGLIAIREKLTDCAGNSDDAKNDCVNPARGSVQAMARTDENGRYQGWYIHNKLHYGDNAACADAHDLERGLFVC